MHEKVALADHESSSTATDREANAPLTNGSDEVANPTTEIPHDGGPTAAGPLWRSFWTAVQERRSKSTTVPRTKWASLALGQVIALVAAGMNATAYTLSNHYGVQIQLFQMFWMYLLLSLHLTCREPTTDTSHWLPGLRLPLRVPWFIYLLISMLDVLPNFIQLVSFRFTSLTSTTLLGSLTVPSTMLFSYYLLAKQFQLPHYVGVCLCVAGGLLTGWSDANGSSTSSSTDPSSLQVTPLGSLVGDLLAVTAALLYGLGDSVAEYSIKHIHRQEYLGMIGFFGAVFTGISFPLLEGPAVWNLLATDQHSAAFRLQVLGYLLLYIGCVLFYYMSAAWFYTSSDATLLNLSLLTANLWVIGVSVLAYRDAPHPLFYVAAALVVAGVVVYQRTALVAEDSQEHERADEVEGPSEVEALVLDAAPASGNSRGSDSRSYCSSNCDYDSI